MAEEKPGEPWDWRGASIVYVLILSITFLLLSFIQLNMLILTGWEFDFLTGEITAGSILGVWMGTVITEIIILTVTVVFAIYLFKGKFSHFKFRFPPLKYLLIAIGGAFAAYGVSILGGMLQELLPITDPNQAFYDALFTTSNWLEVSVWIVLMMCVVGPCEEIFARGFVQKGFQNSCKKNNIPVILGILVASILFAFVHFDIYRIIPLFFIGIVLGLVFYFTHDNSMASAITHGLYNSVLIVLSFLFL